MKYKKVDIPLEDVLCKFVIISDAEEGPKLRTGDMKKLYHPDSSEVTHMEIVEETKEKEGLEGEVLGGGAIRIRPEARSLEAGYTSYMYGTAPQELVESMLREYAEPLGYSVTVKMGEFMRKD